MINPEYSEDQKPYTGRAMLALAAANAEMIEAVKALLDMDPMTGERIAMSAARNLEQSAGYMRLAVAHA